MKHNMFKTGICLLAVAAFFASCKNTTKDGFSIDETTGVQYRFFKHNESGSKPKIGDFVRAVLVNETENDSVLYNSAKRGGDSTGAIMVELQKRFSGCLEQGLTLMSVGDSAEFKVSADSLAAMNSHGHKGKLPPFIKEGSSLHFYVKLVEIKSAEQMNAEREKMRAKYMAEMETHRAAEPGLIAKYLEDNKYTAKPSADSLFFLMREGKGGKAIKDGDSVYVKYTLMLLDNTVIETSDHGPGHTSMPFVYHTQMSFIKGWVEAMASLHEGEKTRILLPSSIAYGAQGSQRIQPYTPLVFDLEITKVISPKK